MNVGEGPLRWPVGLFQLRFPPWLKPLATQLVYTVACAENFHGGFIQWHMVVICLWCAVFVTS